MMAAAGGMAAVGLMPVVTTFAVFCLRAVEQARLSLCYARRNAKIVASHPGLDVGPDGGSAQALEDLAAFRAIPGMTVISPADPIEMALATRAMLEFDGPVYMRTGRSPAPRLFGDDHKFEIGKGQILRDGTRRHHRRLRRRSGPRAGRRRAAGGGRHRGARGQHGRPSSRSTPTCSRAAPSETGAIVTAEDHNIHGGLGGAVAEALARHRALPDRIRRREGRVRRIGRAGRTGRCISGSPRRFIAAAARKAHRRARRQLMSRFSLAGKNAVVTGGSRGIGRAIALGLAEAGADVVADLSREARRSRCASSEQIEAMGRRALARADGCHRPRQRRSRRREQARALRARSRSWSTMPASTSRPISTR